MLKVIARSAYSVPLAHQEPMSVRPSVSDRLRPYRSAKSPQNGPPETDLRAEIPGSRVPFLVHFGDLAQIRQLTQSGSIIHILCVDDKKKPRNELLKAPPPLRVLSSNYKFAELGTMTEYLETQRRVSKRKPKKV